MNRHRVLQWLAIAAIAFGAVTLFSGGQALFGGPQARAAVGAAVPFVLWFNFCAGFVYILAGVGLLWRSRWAVYASIFLALLTALIAVAFGVFVQRGGPFEIRTIGAMAIRSLFWVVIAIVAMSTIKTSSNH